MRLKRHYQREQQEGGQPGALVLDAATGKPVLDYMEVHHTGTTPEQHFSADLVAAGLAEGWLSIRDGVLTLHARPEDLRYTIRRVPGKYAAPGSASGFEVIHFYDCVLDAAQHATYCAKTEAQRREDLYLAKGITPKRKAHVKEVARG